MCVPQLAMALGGGAQSSLDRAVELGEYFVPAAVMGEGAPPEGGAARLGSVTEKVAVR